MMGFVKENFAFFLICTVNSLKVFKLTDYDAAPNSRVEILHSEIHEYDQFTVCGRFWAPFNGSMPNIYLGLVYKPLYWVFSRMDFKNCEYLYGGCTLHFKKKIPYDWTPGTSVGSTYFNTKDRFFDGWKPEMWNAFCIIGDSKDKTLSIFINGRNVYKADDYEGKMKMINHLPNFILQVDTN